MEARIQALEKEILERRQTEAKLRKESLDSKSKNTILVKLLADLRIDLNEKINALELFQTDMEKAMDALIESQAALKKAKEAADAANRSTGELLAKMSHEIRMPVSRSAGHGTVAVQDRAERQATPIRATHEKLR